MKFRSRFFALLCAAGVVTLGGGAAPLAALALAPTPLVIGVDNASPSGHNYQYVAFFPKSGTKVHGKDVVDFKFNPGSTDGLHTVTFGANPGDNPDTTRAGYPAVIPDADDGAGNVVANPAVFGPSGPPCGDTSSNACSYNGTAFLNSGAMPTGPGGHYYVAMNLTATQAPVTVYFLCLLHAGMQASLVVDDTNGAVSSTQSELDAASATQYTSETTAANAKVAAVNSTSSTANSDGTKTWTVTAGTAVPDVEILEMLPKSISIHTGDKVKYTTTTMTDIHTVTFPDGAGSASVDPLAPPVCEGGPPDTPATGSPPAFNCGSPANAESPILPQPQGPSTLAGPTTVATSGIIAAPGGGPFPDNYTFKFGSAGTYTYMCRIHDHMVGSVLAANVVVPTLPAAGGGPARGALGGPLQGLLAIALLAGVGLAGALRSRRN